MSILKRIVVSTASVFAGAALLAGPAAAATTGPVAISPIIIRPIPYPGPIHCGPIIIRPLVGAQTTVFWMCPLAV